MAAFVRIRRAVRSELPAASRRPRRRAPVLKRGAEVQQNGADLAELSKVLEKPPETSVDRDRVCRRRDLLPALRKLLPKYPDIHVEVVID